MKDQYDHIIWTGKLDQWFDYSEGKLSYRTLKFEKSYADGDFQGNAVINYGDENVKLHVFQSIAFRWEKHEQTIYFKEYSSECTDQDIPYYPVRLADDKSVLEKYLSLAKKRHNVTFTRPIGHLQLYGYGCNNRMSTEYCR